MQEEDLIFPGLVSTVNWMIPTQFGPEVKSAGLGAWKAEF